MAWAGNAFLISFTLRCAVPAKVKADGAGYSASLWANPIVEALVFFIEITQFYLLTTSLSTNGTIPAYALISSRIWSSFTDPGVMEG